MLKYRVSTLLAWYMRDILYSPTICCDNVCLLTLRLSVFHLRILLLLYYMVKGGALCTAVEWYFKVQERFQRHGSVDRSQS